MAHAAMAAFCLAFTSYFKKLDEKFRQLLDNENFNEVLQWASTFEAPARSPEAKQELLLMLQAFNTSDEEVDRWLEQAKDLYALACDLAPSAYKRVGSIHGLELSADLETHRRAGHFLKEKEDLWKLEAAALQDLPIAWWGKVYRRTEGADTAHKREEDEQKERARWAKKLAGLLLEANLPFVRALGGASVDGASLRCCRGLRAHSCAKDLLLEAFPPVAPCHEPGPLALGHGGGPRVLRGETLQGRTPHGLRLPPLCSPFLGRGGRGG